MEGILISLSLSVDIVDSITQKRLNTCFVNNTSRADRASLPYVRKSVLSACDALKADIMEAAREELFDDVGTVRKVKGTDL